VENDQQESVRKLAQAFEVPTKIIHATLHKDLPLSKKSARWVTKLLYLGDKEGVSQDAQGIRSNKRRHFLTI
jgi:hypothetical protein